MAVGGQACGAPEMIKIRKLICSHALAFSLRFVHGDDVVDMGSKLKDEGFRFQSTFQECEWPKRQLRPMVEFDLFLIDTNVGRVAQW